MALNIAKIIPHLKPDKDDTDPNSFRPISILNALAKIIDTVISEQIKEFLDKYDIVPYNHNGGLKGHSTTTTVIVMLDMWSKMLEEGKNGVVLQLDQSSAYDMVKHDILLEKLKVLGFDKNSITWMKSYLSNR